MEVIIEAVPSPAPAPQFSSIVLAQSMNECIFSINYNLNRIIINVIKNTYYKYVLIITQRDPFWRTHLKYFQDDFQLFGNILQRTLMDKEGELTFNIEEENEEHMIIELKNSGSFKFSINITIPNNNQATELHYENRMLKEENANLKIIKEQRDIFELECDKLAYENLRLKHRLEPLHNPLTPAEEIEAKEEIESSKCSLLTQSEKKMILDKDYDGNECQLYDTHHILSNSLVSRHLKAKFGDVIKFIDDHPKYIGYMIVV